VSRIAGVLAIIASFIAADVSAALNAEEILRSSLTLLRDAKAVSVRAVVSNDEVVTTGQKLQRTQEGILKIRRPDRLRIDLIADRYSRSILYDGKTLLVYDPDQKFYATFPAPNTIDATAKTAREKLGLDLPLSQLFASDPIAAINNPSRIGTYVGLHRIGTTICHHLAFSQNNVDWQIWVAAEGQPVPRKIVIDYKNLPGRPQYIALLSDWNFAAKLDDATFRFAAPGDAQKIEFIQGEGQ
jgi:hypothetical protein